MCPGRSPQPIPSTAYGVSFTRLLWRSNFRARGRKREGRSACPNSIFSGRYRADVTSDTRGSFPGRMPFRIIGGRGRMVIRRRGRLIIKFILFTGAKGKLNYTPHHILLETVSFLCDFFLFFSYFFAMARLFCMLNIHELWLHVGFFVKANILIYGIKILSIYFRWWKWNV